MSVEGVEALLGFPNYIVYLPSFTGFRLANSIVCHVKLFVRNFKYLKYIRNLKMLSLSVVRQLCLSENNGPLEVVFKKLRNS